MPTTQLTHRLRSHPIIPISHKLHPTSYTLLAALKRIITVRCAHSRGTVNIAKSQTYGQAMRFELKAEAEVLSLIVWRFGPFTSEPFR